MLTRSKSKTLVTLTGIAALIAFAANLVVSALASRRRKTTKDVVGMNFRVDLSAEEILKLADLIVAKFKQVHDAVSSLPLDIVTYANVIQPLAEQEAQHLWFSLVFSQKMVPPSGEVRKASAEAERRIAAHQAICSIREDIYHVVKVLAAKGEPIDPEATCYIECLQLIIGRTELQT